MAECSVKLANGKVFFHAVGKKIQYTTIQLVNFALIMFLMHFVNSVFKSSVISIL